MYRIFKEIIFSILTISLISSCNFGLLPPSNQLVTEENPETLAMIIFNVKLPEPLPAGESLYLVQLDEVAGLSFNQIRHIMEADDDKTFHVNIPLPLNSLIKYRYLRMGEFGHQEYALNGEPVRYRIYYAKEPTIVNDAVGQWLDRDVNQATGRLTGKVIDSNTGEPVPNLLITVGGMHHWTSSSGEFQIHDLPVGIHNVVVYAPDGSYTIFQQEASIEAETATEAVIQVEPAKSIKVTFTVEVPDNTPPGMTMRIVGNFSQLGNSYSELRGGISHTATRLPILSPQPNGRYSLSIDLPAGHEIRYKYTLGDGIWNAERDMNGDFIVRRIVLPDRNNEYRDRVVTWKDTSRESIHFTVDVPVVTPVDEMVSIQFNPGYSWLEPIPMTNKGSNTWEFDLFSPLKGLETIQYRFCRDVQCGSADDIATQGGLAQGRILDLTVPVISVADRVENWAWYEGIPPSAVVPNLEIPTRAGGFVAGIELQEGHHPSWFSRFPETIKDVSEINANWIVLNSSWSYTSDNPPLLESVRGRSIPNFELVGLLNYARSLSLNTAIFPNSNYPKSPAFWWAESVRDFPWWVSWFTRYEDFISHHAAIADQTGASTLILGEPSIEPALPFGKLADGSPSNVPEDAITRWIAIINQARQHFDGQIWWALENGASHQELSALYEHVDGFYILIDAQMTQDLEPGIDDLIAGFGNFLDENVLILQQSFAKPVILAVGYPSALGGTTGCLPGIEEKCLDLTLLNRPNPDIPNISIDLQSQEDAYNAVFLAVNERNWISGIVSRGFYPPLPLQDKSISVHGKPASGVLWFWFGRFLGK